MFDTPRLTTGPLTRWFGRVASSLARYFGWATVRYASINLQQRLKHFKALSLGLDPRTSIRFNAHLVPYISAPSDAQAAYALGCITEFLRGPQLQFLKRLAQGRLAEMGGARYVEMDHLIRLLDFGQATSAMLEAMPPSTRAWLEAFVDGLNQVQRQRSRGLDEKWLAIRPEPYTVQDVLLLGRLAGADVNWPIYFSLLECEDDSAAISWWTRLGGTNLGTKLAESLNSLGRTGSNCMAVAGHRSKSGKPLLAGDPHLGQHLPNIWMLVGLQCPSYHCVGMMFPGVPVLGMGRNLQVAWGGTNLRAASSDLVEIDGPNSSLKESSTNIRVRWGFTRKRQLIHSPHGPLLHASKALAPMLRGRRIALKWTGHWPTDEITAFLSIMKSQCVQEVHQALGTMGVTPLNVVCADVHGSIQHSLATTLPKRNGFQEGWLLRPEKADMAWSERLTAHELPCFNNPASGVLVSTNNKPQGADQVSFYFNGDERHARAIDLLENLKTIGIEDLLSVQMDSVSPKAKLLAEQLGQWLSSHGRGKQPAWVAQVLAQWDGSYSQTSKACLIFEGLVYALVKTGGPHFKGGQAKALLEEWAYLTSHLLEDLTTLSKEQQTELANKAANSAAQFAKKWVQWGHVHKVRPRHILGYVPLLGKLFSSKALPADGSRETLHKNAHGLMSGYAESAYGSQSRHWHDLADPDANHFVLLGGQDGWVGSQLMTDQIELWQWGQTVCMPLTAERVAKEFVF